VIALNDRRLSTVLRAGLLAVAFAAAAGCGQSRTVRVEGQVRWDDGSPAGDLDGYLVESFIPGSVSSSRSSIGPDGRFAMSTFGREDGVEPGTHKVRITLLARGEFEPPPKVKLPPRYANPDTSGLSFTAERGRVNVVTLTVSRR
jgi:hypothetical protein